MLVNNGTYIRARFLGGALGGMASVLGVEERRRIANAVAFGSKASWPVGYQSATRAMVPPLGTSGQIAARFTLDLDFAADLRGIGNMAATFAPDFNATVAANVLSNTSATFAVEFGFDGDMRATGFMSAVFDLISRPSANDISQEIWNSFAIEGGLNGGDVLRVLLAVAAGKTAIVPGAPTVVTFRDQADTKDRVRAEMTDSERDATTVDGAA